jgi:hypothetical protein
MGILATAGRFSFAFGFAGPIIHIALLSHVNCESLIQQINTRTAMKIIGQILALCVLNANVWEATAFTVKSPSKASPVVLRESSSEITAPISSADDEPLFPVELAMQRIEGGKTVRTYQMPDWAERVQMVLTTNGRPLKAHIQLWLGPIRQTHYMNIDSENGVITPFRANLRFKKGPQVLRISSSEDLEFPILAAVAVPSPERSAELDALTTEIWENSPKTLIQGGPVDGGNGAVRTFPVPADVDAVQVMFWSRDTGKKSLKAKIEVLQGPNNKKQSYDLQLGGGSQPYHAVFETPGSGWMIRITNGKYIEDGLFETLVMPYDRGDLAPLTKIKKAEKQWWE